MSMYLVHTTMPNKLFESGHGLAVYVTRQARMADMVEEDADGDPVRRADTRVFSFNNVLLALDLEEIVMEDMVELVDSAMTSTHSIHRAVDSQVQTSGNGYRLQFPSAEAAGFREGQKVGFTTAPGMLVVTPYENDRDAANVARSLKTQRLQQIEDHAHASMD